VVQRAALQREWLRWWLRAPNKDFREKIRKNDFQEKIMWTDRRSRDMRAFAEELEVRARARTCAHFCVRACVRAWCTRLCVCVCVCVRMRVRVCIRARQQQMARARACESGSVQPHGRFGQSRPGAPTGRPKQQRQWLRRLRQ
jgi:hypothetical protein